MTQPFHFDTLRLEQFDANIAIRNRSFRMHSASDIARMRDRAPEAIEAGRFVALNRSGAGESDPAGALVGTAWIWDMQQYWRGRPVPMAGIGGVVIAPEARGSGAGSALMSGVLQRSRELGAAVSVLYPAVMGLYRKAGYELAGTRTRLVATAADVAQGFRRSGGACDVQVRPVVAADLAAVSEMMAEVLAGQQASGPVVWPDYKVREFFLEDESFAYLAIADGRPAGVLRYTWADSEAMQVDLALARTRTARAALWQVAASTTSVAPGIRSFCGPDDPVVFESGAKWEADSAEVWMLRIVDPAAALSARGYPPGVSADLVLELTDEQLTDNSGAWRFSVAGGVGHCERHSAAGEPGTVRLTVNGLSALYASRPVMSLRAAGLVDCDDATANVLAAVFAGGPAHLPDFF